VTLLDAYALIAFLVGGPAAPMVRVLLREGDAAVTSTNLAETLDVSQRVYGLEIQRSMDLLDPLLQGPLTAISLDLRLARSAAEMRASHYHRTSRPISLADAVLLASAKAGDRIATADPDVLAIAEIERLATVELPEQG
jgi:predicted nucleic acid-binding protein